MVECEICKKQFEERKKKGEWYKLDMVRHHVSYLPAKTMLVCWSCHNKIHRQGLYPSLLPPIEDASLRYCKKGWHYDKRGMLLRPMTEEEKLRRKEMVKSERGVL